MFYLFLCCTCLLSKDYQYSPGTGSCKEDLLAKWSWLILSTSMCDHSTKVEKIES